MDFVIIINLAKHVINFIEKMGFSAGILNNQNFK
jgi:hypothetical protein